MTNDRPRRNARGWCIPFQPRGPHLRTERADRHRRAAQHWLDSRRRPPARQAITLDTALN